ncbi:MAG: hypothetical protein NTW66_03705 [Candidatus Magasanikbacteria bacterium]|nr:hypothetical protein [Candidatus Magasanikbacteria bacterium]
MMNRKQFFFFFSIYFLIRVFSFYFNPPTPLLHGSTINTALSLIILGLASYWMIKGDLRGWLIVAAEIVFCGSGNILSIFSVSLRTALLAASLSIYFVRAWRKDKLNSIIRFKLPNILIFLLIDWAAIAAVIGAWHGHQISLIFSDFIPYLFFLYYFPLVALLKSDKFKAICFNMLIAAIVANAFFVICSFIAFYTGQSVLQDGYYHWFRDVAQGKITVLGYNFFRIVLNEHLVLVPILLFFAYRNMRRPDRINDLCIVSCTALLSLNLTRIYLLALLAGLFILFSKKYLRQWLLNSFILLSCIFIFYTGFSLLSSKGQNPGWSYFGFRAFSIVMPETEFSSLSRMILLPQILYKIQLAPIFGHGLGDTVTVHSNYFSGSIITTPQFDWGFLEIIDETGAIGFILWLAIIFYILRVSKKNMGDFRPLYASILSALLIINITSPALFHVLGIITLTLLMALGRAFSAPPTGTLQSEEPLLISNEDGKQTLASTG